MVVAAIIMVSVFAGFVFSDDPMIKQFGFALAVGVVIAGNRIGTDAAGAFETLMPVDVVGAFGPCPMGPKASVPRRGRRGDCRRRSQPTPTLPITGASSRGVTVRSQRSSRWPTPAPSSSAWTAPRRAVRRSAGPARKLRCAVSTCSRSPSGTSSRSPSSRWSASPPGSGPWIPSR